MIQIYKTTHSAKKLLNWRWSSIKRMWKYSKESKLLQRINRWNKLETVLIKLVLKRKKNTMNLSMNEIQKRIYIVLKKY